MLKRDPSAARGYNLGNDKIIEYLEVFTRCFANSKIPGCNDISLVMKFPKKILLQQ